MGGVVPKGSAMMNHSTNVTLRVTARLALIAVMTALATIVTTDA